MKKFIFTFIAMLSVLVFTLPTRALAVESPNNQAITIDDHTAREEAEGKEIWEKLQSKQLECQSLTDDDYGSLGEYFMGQMVGGSHEAMNTMMERMMGKEGEEQMHVVMGKRLSGCQSAAQFPSAGTGFMPMMFLLRQGFGGQGMMGGGGNPMMGQGWGGMMGGWGGFGLGWLSILLFWGLLILGVVALIRYLGGSTRSNDKERSPLDILKERYAKGEIDKKEFEQMKKEIA